MRLFLLSCALVLHVSLGQLILTSPAFEKFESIPKKYLCDEVLRDSYRPSLPLSWARPPSATRSFVLLVDDMTDDGKVQWLVKDIPASSSALVDEASEIAMPLGSKELTNSFGYDSYTGPCPPGEEHTYRIRLFAMPTAHTVIKLPPDDPTILRADNITSQIEEEALISAVLVGKAKVAVPQEGDKFELTGNIGVNEHRNNMVQAVAGQNTYTYSLQKLDKGMRTDFTQEVAKHRYLKPSEVYKPKKEIPDVEVVPANCEDVKPGGMSVAECLIKKAKASAVKNAQSMLVQTEMKATTKELVKERVDRFRHDIETWSCESEYRRRKGQRLVHGNRTECPLRVRVTDAQCSDKAMWPRQFVCGNGTGNATLSPSISWASAPQGTQSFVFMVEESSPPPFVTDYGRVFWIVSDVPPTVTSVDAGASGTVDMPPLAFELRNSFGATSYTAPCPGAHEVREYRVRVFAMPHQRTRIQYPQEMRAGAVTALLQKEALCMATTELPFSYKKAPITPARFERPVADMDTAGESVPMMQE